MRASHSTVTAFERCQKAYEFRYVKRVRYQPAWAIKGSALHEAITLYWATLLATGEMMSAEAVMESFRETVRQRLSAIGREEHGEPLWFANESPERILVDGVAQLRTYLMVIAPTITPVAVEEKLSMVLPSGVEVRGWIDLVDDHLKIHDEKFPEVLPSGEATLAEWQPIIYSALWHHQTGVWPRAFAFDVVARGKAKRPKPVVAQIEIPISESLVRARLEDFETIVEAMADAGRTGRYPRRPSQMNCGKCVYKVPCWNGVAQILTRPTFEPATLDAILHAESETNAIAAK